MFFFFFSLQCVVGLIPAGLELGWVVLLLCDMYPHAADPWRIHKLYWLIVCFVTMGLKKYWVVCTILSVFVWVTVRLMICTCPQWALHRTLPLKTHYIARIWLLDQQGIRNSWGDSILGSLVLICFISISSSPAKRGNSFSMVHEMGALEFAPGFFYHLVWGSLWLFCIPLLYCIIFSAIKHM